MADTESTVTKRPLDFNPATDIDALNRYFLPVLERMVANPKLSLADFAEGADNPEIGAMFDDIERESMNHINFVLISIMHVFTLAKEILQMYEIYRGIYDLTVSTYFKTLCNSLSGLEEKHKRMVFHTPGNVHDITNNFPSLVIKTIQSMDDAKDGSYDELAAAINPHFCVNIDLSAGAFAYASPGDYGYILHEIAGLVRLGSRYSFDGFADNYADMWKSPKPPYPSVEIMDRCIELIAQLLPRIYCEGNQYLALHSDPAHVKKIYIKACGSRPVTTQYPGKWTAGILGPVIPKTKPEPAAQASTASDATAAEKAAKAKEEKNADSFIVKGILLIAAAILGITCGTLLLRYIQAPDSFTPQAIVFGVIFLLLYFLCIWRLTRKFIPALILALAGLGFVMWAFTDTPTS